MLNVVLLVIVGYSTLPDFSLNKGNFERVSGLISEVRMETYEERRPKEYLFNNIVRERLIMTIADQNYHEYYISDIYEKHWNELLSTRNNGKKAVLYLGVGKQREDPFRIEIDDKVVYDTDIRYKRNILIIGFTLALTCYNFFGYFKSNTNAIQIINKKVESIKHYF